MSNYLFAYGFLKRRFHGNTTTKTPPMDVRFVCEGTYPGKIYRVAAYPGVSHDPSGEHWVKGEVFEINDPDQLIPVLDEFENAHPLVTENPTYARVLRTIQTPVGALDCWVYEYLLPMEERTRIESGEF